MQKTRIKETTMITLWAYQRLVSNNWCPLIFLWVHPWPRHWQWMKMGCACVASAFFGPAAGKDGKQPGPPPFKDRKVATIQQEIPVSEPTYPKIIGVTCWAQRMAWWYLDTLITPNWFTKHDQKNTWILTSAQIKEPPKKDRTVIHHWSLFCWDFVFHFLLG